MERYEKVYVSMFLRVDTDGKMKPAAVEWSDGRRYKIENILGVHMSPPAHTGGVLTEKYRVRISGTEKNIYYETNTGRWFVEKLL